MIEQRDKKGVALRLEEKQQKLREGQYGFQEERCQQLFQMELKIGELRPLVCNNR